MKPIICKRTLLSFMFVILASLSSFAQQTLWVGQSYKFDVSSSVMGITANMSWSTNGGYLSLSGSGFYRTITVTQYFSGTATVTCEWDYKLTGNGSYTHTKRQVTISCRDNQVSISPTSMTMSPGETKYVSYRHQYDNQYTSTANAYFQSSDPSICTVSSSGEVMAKNPGTTYINVYSKISSVSPYCRVTVENVTPTSVSIPSTMSMTVGEQKTLSASVYPTNAQTGINWKTSNSEIASVSSTGTVTALKYGTAQITVSTDNGLSSTCNVTVNKSQLSLSSSHNSGLISTGSEVQLNASNQNASIYYTTNGSNPSASSHKYVEPIIISKSTTLKAVAVHPDYLDSEILELNFEVTSLTLLNTIPQQGERNSAPHLYPCFIFNSPIKEDTEYNNIKVVSDNETVPFETIINGDKLYIVPEKPLTNNFFTIEIPERSLATSSSQYNTSLYADFDYSTSEVNLVDTWTAHSRLMDNHDLYIWGYKEDFPNTSYNINSYQGIPIKALTGIKRYYDSNYYITDDDVLMGWGHNYNDYLGSNPDNSILGDGTKYHRDSAVKIAENVSRIETGWTSGLIKNDGTLWLWGQNRFGQIGNGKSGTNNYVLSPVKVLSNVKDFSLGTWHSLALKKDGSVWAWGYNKAIGKSSSASSPIKIMDSGVVEIKAGSDHNLLLKENGDVYCFGENNYGQIGIGSTTTYEAPCKVMSGVKHISAGYGGSYALKSNGDLYRWGIVGHRTSSSIYKPELISSNIFEFYVTDGNVIILKEDNSVWYMGESYCDTDFTTTFSKIFDDVETVWPLYDKMFVKKTDGSYWGIGRGLGIDKDWQKYNHPVEVLTIPFNEVTSISLPEEMVIELGCKGIALLEVRPIDANYQNRLWTSLNSQIAAVDDNGIVYGNSIGETTIEATLTGYSNTYNSNCIVKVVEAGAGIETIEKTLRDGNVYIYDMNGIVVYKEEVSSIPDLDSGIYIIKSKSKTIKYLKR